MLAVQSPSVYEVGGPSIAATEGPSFPLPAPGLPIPPSVIYDLSTRFGNLEYGHGQLVKKVQVLQAAVQQRDTQIQQLQTTVTEISSRESTLMQCILGMDRRLADLERRPLGPQ
ncbi:hypothetical protein Tco_1210056 [Tanacetum coccineum]